MKNVTLNLLYVLLISAVVLVWVKLISYLLALNNIADISITYIIAPLSETLFYIYLPILIATAINKRFYFDIKIPILMFVGFQFILLHETNYDSGGRYIACVFQGVMYFFSCLIFLKIRGKGSFWYTSLFHSLYNLGIYFFI